jgi:lysophospholipase L1-like esterase
MKKKLLCLGDSLTEGYEISNKSRWTDLLKNDLNIEVINCGIGGDTTTGMLSRCERLLLEHEPTHVIILGGTNDLWFGLKDEHILSNIHAMARQVNFYNSRPVIGIPSPSINLNEVNLIHENYSECIRSFQDVLINYCIQDNLDYIDFSKRLTEDHFLPDGVHLNEKGQTIMKENAKERILEM